MKTKYYLPFIVLAAFLTGCNQVRPEEASAAEECEISFNPVGEITTSEQPLSRATATNDLYLIQVFRDGSKFSSGVFDNLQDKKLYLKKGSTYRIIIVMVKDAKTLLGSDFDLSTGKFTGTYSANTFKHSSGSYTINKWWVNSTYSFNNIEKAVINNQYPNCKDWFYYELNGYSPTGQYETLDVDFKRVCFGLKYELAGVTDGQVTVTVKNSTRTFIENTTTTATYVSDAQTIAFYNAHDAWQYADNYMEKMDVSVVWVRGIGVTQDLGTKSVQVKRNCLNNIKITLGSDDKDAGLHLTTEEESSIGAMDVTIPVS